MAKSITYFMAFYILFIASSCKKEKADDVDNQKQSTIVYSNVNKEFVLIRDIALLQASDDPISLYVDSILNGLIDADLVSTGLQKFDLNNDGEEDIAFEIIDLLNLNNGYLPPQFDSLAARVIPFNLQILDQSTFGYPDALVDGNKIEDGLYWTSFHGVLGTFANAGQFQGKGDRYLGIRINTSTDFLYGWVRLNCSQHNDTLKIISFAYNTVPGGSILAGQTE
jgi:hypothetical protein